MTKQPCTLRTILEECVVIGSLKVRFFKANKPPTCHPRSKISFAGHEMKIREVVVVDERLGIAYHSSGQVLACPYEHVILKNFRPSF